ncbi:MAG TPA: hypothetical protein PKE00_01090, partial [Planctomycetota bacterium]|nr:hypothetical protein [Planctomycetota bacterium]
MTSTRLRTTILVVLASSVLAVLAFGPGLRGAFLNFDDPRTVLENPAFLEGGVAGFERIFDPTSTIADVYLPVTYTSLWIDHALTRWSGANPLVHTWIYHAQSLLWHVVAALLLFAILTTLRLGRTLAFAATALFLVHPALAESVGWISSRKDVLSGALAFACFFFGQRVVLRNASLWPVAISAVLACYAKATAIVIPLVGALLWLATAKVARDAAGVPVSSAGESAGESETSTTVLDGARRRVAACVLVSLVIAVLAGVHHLYLAAQAGTAAFDAEARVVPGTFLHYLRVALWPDDLAVHRPRGLQDSFSQDAELRALWLLVLLAAAAVCWRRGKHEVRLVGIGLLAFFAALLPFNGFKPAFAVAAADRYLYLALPGLALVFAAGGAALEEQLARVLRPVVVRRIVGLVVVGGLLV